MNLIDKEQGRFFMLPGIRDNRTHFLHAAEHSGEFNKWQLEGVANELGKGGLPGAGRSPKHQRRRTALPSAELAEQVAVEAGIGLEFIPRVWPQSLRQWSIFSWLPCRPNIGIEKAGHT